jgi:hypothetical protein
MKKGNELLIFDQAWNLYTHLGLPDDCIDSKNDFSILNMGNYPVGWVLPNHAFQQLF